MESVLGASFSSFAGGVFNIMKGRESCSPLSIQMSIVMRVMFPQLPFRLWVRFSSDLPCCCTIASENAGVGSVYRHRSGSWSCASCAGGAFSVSSHTQCCSAVPGMQLWTPVTKINGSGFKHGFNLLHLPYFSPVQFTNCTLLSCLWRLSWQPRSTILLLSWIVNTTRGQQGVGNSHLAKRFLLVWQTCPTQLQSHCTAYWSTSTISCSVE